MKISIHTVIRNCKSFDDTKGCMTGCKSAKVPRQNACPYNDGKDFEQSGAKYQQHCLCFK